MDKMVSKEIYSRQPRSIERGVPIFIDRQNDRYVENYDEISTDHIASLKNGKGNPFIDSTTWDQIERNAIAQGKWHIKPGMKILDVGVGTGRLLSHFPEARRYGIDVSINYAERLLDSGAEIAVGKVEELPYIDGAFDVVFCTDVLEHVENLLTASTELVRIVKPDGILIVRVPYRENLSLYLQDDYPYRLAHLRNFDEHGLRLLFERQLGLNAVKIDFDYSTVPALLRLPLPRGRTLLTRVIVAALSTVPKLDVSVRWLFRPVEITVSFHKATRDDGQTSN